MNYNITFARIFIEEFWMVIYCKDISIRKV